ncbi:alpha/beta-hydrolase [Periconia macrospinosa]|uniref:Alpha/beta-hydrolase n=1 Tax=Periconia macrospinosa TaxID=97972 RepID=A0A2V1DS68_9PLEO|nr:alpha/beta-hydrolase [Periconia macrospinosa]
MLSPSSSILLPLLSVTVAIVRSAPTNNYINGQARPYQINVDPKFIEQTRQKVSDFRTSIELEGPAWADGPPLADITEFGTYWTETYNWTAVQDKMNSEFSQFITTLPSPGEKYNLPVDMYFRHERSSKADAIPLLMLHGWPSTSLEFEKVIPELVNPTDDSPAFHVVAPDYPGFGFSPAAKTAGLGAEEHSVLFATLMEQLGYDKYAVYSTDAGFFIAQDMVVRYEKKIINHISDFYIVMPNNTDTARYSSNQTTQEETAYLNSLNAFLTDHTGYSAIHSTFPLSIAYALNDSPLGFLAWMYQGYFTVNDNAYKHTSEEIITQALLLYIPGVYGNIRAYKEMYGLELFAAKKKSSVPTSALQYGGTDGYPALANWNYVPRDWVERNANVTYFARHERGGHFPAVTQPELVIQDIKASFKQLGY